MPDSTDLATSAPPRASNKRIVIALTLTAALAATGLYLSTLRLPVIYDDLLHIRITKGLDLGSVWLPTDAFGFYRPLTFFPLLVIKGLFSTYPAPLLHGLNVAQHALNAALLALLSWRLWQRRHWMLAAGLLFALFPFSYQAIAVYGHNVHPATLGLLLLALHTYLSAIQGRSLAIIWWLLTGFLFVLSLLSHESAILFGAFAALVHWNACGRLPEIDLRRPLQTLRGFVRQPWFIFLILGFLYLIAYQFLPLSRAPQAGFSGGDLWSKFLYLVQAAAYPISWFGHWFGEGQPVASIVVLSGLAIMLGLTAWSAGEPDRRLPLLLGWSWWGLASLLIALPLPAGYLLHGPRLLYLSSAGLAFLWPVLLEPIYRLSRVGRPIWAGLLAFTLIANWLFVSSRLEAYRRLTDPVAVVKQVMAGRPEGEGIILVNLPSWLDTPANTYPIGVEFVAMLGNYLFVEELMTENLGVDRPVQAYEVPDLLSQQPYPYGIHNQADGSVIEGDWAPAGSQIFIVRYNELGPKTLNTGRLVYQPDEDQALATMGPYQLVDAQAERCDGAVLLTTSWQPASIGQTVSPTSSIFSQLISTEGLLSQSDGPPLGLRPDLLQMQPGWFMIDRRELPLQLGQDGWVIVGVYDFASAKRYPAFGSDGQLLPDNAYFLSLQECSQ